MVDLKVGMPDLQKTHKHCSQLPHFPSPLSFKHELGGFTWEGFRFNVKGGGVSRLKPGGRRSEKAGLEKRTDVCVCVVVQTTCYCEHNACRHARLGHVQTGKLLLIGQRPVVEQTERPHADDARASLPRPPQGRAYLKAM